MAKNASVTVTSDPTILYQANGPNPETVLIDNTGAGTITLGGKQVVAGQGPQIASSAAATAITINEDILYAICPSGQTATVLIAAWISR